MRRLLAVPALVLSLLSLALAFAPPARAATTPPGVNIRWDHCYGDGGVKNKIFACDTNIGVERLALSFELSAPVSGVAGIGFRVVRESASPTLPVWWRFGIGACRQGALSLVLTPPPGTATCVDWGAGFEIGGIGTDTVSTFEPNQAGLHAVTAVPPTNLATLSPGTEYFAGVLQISHTKTIGTGSCAGCAVPVCLVFASLQVSTLDNPAAVWLTGGANGPDSQIATWQNGKVDNLQNVCTPPGSPERLCYTSMDCVLGPTPARASTWGQVKSLYR